MEFEFMISFRRDIPASLIGMALILFPAKASGQPCSLSMQVSHTAAEQLSLADLDFPNFHSTNLLFTVTFTNRGVVAANASLHLIMDITLAQGSINFPGALDLTTKAFPVPPGGRTITNLNLGPGGDIQTQTYSFSREAKTKIEDIALLTGHMPAGSYNFHIELKELGCATTVNDQIELLLQNPTRVELRSPRDGETTNTFPLFEFFQDGYRAVLTVAEKSPEQTREDAISRKPPMLEVDLSGRNSFLYSGGRPLEDGKTYVWTVVSKVRTAGGLDIDVASPIGLFSVSGSLQGSGSLGAVDDALLTQLEEILGSKHHAVFQQIRSGGYRLTSNMSLNDSKLSASQLLDLLIQLRDLSDSIELSFE